MSADFHAMTAGAVAKQLGVDPSRGLTGPQAIERLAQAGPNQIEVAKRDPVWRMILEAATEPFVLMLAVAGVLAILVGEVRDGLLVLFGLLPIVGADVATEYRGERALEALRAASSPVARVRRGGEVSVIPAADLVTGDVVLMSGGDVVPADMRITRSERLLLDRSVLTGESIPEDGRVEPDPEAATLAGGFTAVAALAVMLLSVGDFAHSAWLAYTVLVVSQCVRAYWNRSIREPIHRLGRNGFLLAACVTAVAVQALIPYVPVLASASNATPLGAYDWMLVVVVAFAPAVVAELARMRARGSLVWVA